MDFSNYTIRKALMTLTVKNILLNIGKPILEKVTSKLYDKYRCHIPDCFDHPEYLKNVLQEIFGDSCLVVILSINNELDEFAHHEGMNEFLQVISR